MDVVLLSVIGVVALALLFDFTNGFHDAANATATVIATRSLKPRTAVLVSAFFNFLPALLAHTAVADTVAKTVQISELGAGDRSVPVGIILTFSALIAAIFWNYFTWSVGLPSSSSHALIGGLVGAGLAAAGTSIINWDSVKHVAEAIVLSPAVAFSVAFGSMFVVKLLQKFTKLHDNHEAFRWAQVASSAAVSYGHGSNDAQKTMGVIAATLGAGGYLTMADDKYPIPTWVVLAANSMIAIGTFWGGWKIIDTMGLKISRLNRNSGVAANVGVLTSVFGATNMGIPISTTHAAASSIMGAGTASGAGVNLRVIREMVVAWLVTLPAAGLVGYVVFTFAHLPGAMGGIAALIMVAALGWWAGALMMNAENADDIEQQLPDEADLDTFDPKLPHPHATIDPSELYGEPDLHPGHPRPHPKPGHKPEDGQ